MEGAILKPGDEDFEVLKKAMEGQMSVDPMTKTIEFTSFPLKQGMCEYALLNLTPTTDKMIFHFMGVSREFAGLISQFFLMEVRGKIVTEAEKAMGAVIEAGENPMLRNHWDVEIYHINRFVSQPKLALIVRKLKESFGR